jgi:hypothetical protein
VRRAAALTRYRRLPASCLTPVDARCDNPSLRSVPPGTMARTTRLEAASMELLRPTAPAEPPHDRPAPPDDVEVEKRDDRAGESQSPLPRARRKRPAPAGKTKARNLRLMEDVHDRLWLLARQRKQSVSAGCTTCSTGPCPGGS